MSKRVPMILAVALVAIVASTLYAARSATRKEREHPHSPAASGPGVLVRLTSEEASRSALGDAREVKSYTRPIGLYWALPPLGTPESRYIEVLKQRPGVVYAEPNSIVYAHQPAAPTPAVTPNDTRYDEQWALHDAGAGLNAPALWAALGTGDADLVIPVIDSGIDCEHKDLAANLWTNTGETPGNKLDDDNNGYVDDVFGVNMLDPKQPPCDKSGHGTYVAGIIAAVGNNGDASNGGKSISGVVWRAKVLSCKFMASDTGELKDAIACLDYVAKLKMSKPGFKIVATNNSWGDLPQQNQALEDAIVAQRDLGILFVTSAGNCDPGASDCNLDDQPRYPASSPQPNVITVAAVDKMGKISTTSKGGRRTVHVAAPGDNILTLNPGDDLAVRGSTSMAAPHVTGLIALLSQSPTADWKSIRNFILTTGFESGSVKQKTISGKAVQGSEAGLKGCVGQSLRARLAPIAAGGTQTVSVGHPVEFRAISLNCTQPAGDVPVTIQPVPTPSTVTTLTLTDDGNGVTADGVYSASWTPPVKGKFNVSFWADPKNRFTLEVQ